MEIKLNFIKNACFFYKKQNKKREMKTYEQIKSFYIDGFKEVKLKDLTYEEATLLNKLEKKISKNPELATWYSILYKKARFLDAEKYIMKNPEFAYRYSIKFFNGRWKKAEPYIAKNLYWNTEYNNRKEMIEGSFPKPARIKHNGSNHYDYYLRYYNIYDSCIDTNNLKKEINKIKRKSNNATRSKS